jgi:hypothetical protein
MTSVNASLVDGKHFKKFKNKLIKNIIVRLTFLQLYISQKQLPLDH